MDDDLADRYPPESGRRRFVKGIVGSGTACSVGTAGTAVLDATTNQAGVDSGRTSFVGIDNVDGPAPRGMPLVPLSIENGELKGQFPTVTDPPADDADYKTAREELGGVEYSVHWFQYCGMEAAEGIDPTADQDDFVRNAGGGYDWQRELETGAKLTVDDFADYEEWDNGIGTPGLGKPAKARWRSEGPDTKEVTVMVLRSTEVSRMVAGEGEYADLQPDVRSFLDAATTQDFMAWLNKCTHYCCVPEFKAAGSAKFDAENQVYCGCHQSVYDPFSPVEGSYVARPRPE